MQNEAWESFRESFLHGEDRKKRFAEILDLVQKDLPSLLEKNSKDIPEKKIKLVTLAGSSAFGPRRPNERLSDIDLNFLIDEQTDKYNFDILPSVEINPDEVPYHLLGTGRSDEARGKNREIHWLLYPHFPIHNSLSDDELKSTINELVASTLHRKGKILESIQNLDKILKEKAQSGAIE